MEKITRIQLNIETTQVKINFSRPFCVIGPGKLRVEAQWPKFDLYWRIYLQHDETIASKTKHTQENSKA